MSSLSPKVLESLSPKGGKPVATPVPVRIPVHVPAGVSEDPDTTNRGDNEGIATFAEPTEISTVQQQPVNKDATGGDENKVELSRFASMFPPQPTIGHDVPLKESDSSNEGEISTGEESDEPEQDRSPESKHEGTGTDVLSSSFTHETTEDKKTGPTAETECVSSESPATELSDKEDMEDDSANRGEKDNRFAQSSDQEKREAIREIESTMNDAWENAVFIKTQSPTWYDRYECKQCKKSGKEADCCHMHWLNKEGKNASKDPSERAMNSILPTVGNIAMVVTKSLTWCTHHGCLNNASDGKMQQTVCIK